MHLTTAARVISSGTVPPAPAYLLPYPLNLTLQFHPAGVRAHSLLLMAAVASRLDRSEADKMVTTLAQVRPPPRSPCPFCLRHAPPSPLSRPPAFPPVPSPARRIRAP